MLIVTEKRRPQFEARETNRNDCKQCHNARGIWRNRNDPSFYICDLCFYHYNRGHQRTGSQQQ